MNIFVTPVAFQWDAGNQDKNFIKHQVTNQECEEVFFSERKKILRDTLHSHEEARYILIGYTKQNRAFFIVFTKRSATIRIISARDLNKKEHQLL